ncbi:glycosyltransferase family 2 protein [Marinobacter sp. NP-4(2019)]|uniref:glycosyltransferase family 2 protein n=1 Tax=Marinobacter sp. NP-4(2019) TaxID=2488665 RepID=UPI000FC3E787|nr:glycosyltransferase family 2 protein [Marinobacter sp. NP-4(2019)]AZT84552.1 glycosyltransferase family 2 protein [Marinobacter sp. NP-4(2019)]
MLNYTIIIPAKNEARSLKTLLPKIKEACPDSEVLVVNDGSTDETSQVCEEFFVTEILHPYSKGNGAAIKSGARAASGDVLVFMDADGQHSPNDILRLVEKLDDGYDMVVGARGSESQANVGRDVANRFYNRLASYVVDHKVEDLTSGFRAVRREKFLEFLYLLPNGFSYPTTSTMAFFRAGYSVFYLPIVASAREGKSHIKPIKDGIRFLLIIFKVGTLYSPLKIFFPLAFFVFMLGTSYYGYTFFTEGRFTNMSALMFTTALIVFMVGLVSEQITALMYKNKE